jgi:5-methylcytosine-specific restriction endonuclease McrA
VTLSRPVPQPKPVARLVEKLKKALESDRQWRKVCREVDRRDGGKCRVCKRAGNHHHHLRRRSRGGVHEAENVVLLCADCHRQEHDARVRLSGNANNLLVLERWDGSRWQSDAFI